MASRSHCFYCFECLSASFERRSPLTLDRVVDLYQQYKNPGSPALDDGIPGEDEADHAGAVERESEEEADEDEIKPAPAGISPPRLQVPSISRLQALTPSSRSSVSSTPSVMSASSSNTQLTTSTSVSTISSRPSYASRLSINESFPMFVTWNTSSRSGNKSLRGCIGTFDALPLASGLQTYALTSAFDDTRFSPIPSSLVPSLSCAITLLADFESCHDAMDWTLGRHGLRINFTYRGRRHGATYLPDVAVEQGWDKEETVESLMRKAGWDGSSGHRVAKRILRGSSRAFDNTPGKPWDEVTDFRAVRYTGFKASATYAEWNDFKQWTKSQKESER